jgi:hypothetical protein
MSEEVVESSSPQQPSPNCHPPKKKMKVAGGAKRMNPYGNAKDGHAASTKLTYNSAKNCCDRIMRDLDEPTIDELTELDAE